MRRVMKWLVGGVAFTVLLLGAIAAGAFFLLTKTVTPYEGSATLAKLSAEVEVVRDQYGVAHIEAETREDAIRTLGWVHASERIWQMEVLRMAAQGRLSEMFGEKTVPSDRFLKTLDLATPAKNSVKALRTDTRQFLQAYSEGVNAWLNRKTGTFEPSLPIEFIVLGHKPEAWEPWQSLAVLKVMALTLDANLDEEIGRLALAGRGFNARQIEEVFAAGPKDNPPPLPDLRQLYGFGNNGKLASKAAYSNGDQQAKTPLATAPWTLQLPASNNWAISGSKSETGKPLLANDPHLGLTVPSTFFLAHLKWREGESERDLIGGSLPGTPLILSGRNNRIAWGLTTTYLDSQDVFLERLNPLNPNEYLVEGDRYEAFEQREVTIKVKGGEDVDFFRRESRHGPVLPDGYKKLRERLPDGHVAALAWTALSDSDTTFDGAFDIGIAESVGDFVARTDQMKSPMQSIVVADVDGAIGIVAPGDVPVRSSFNRIAGRAPVPGWVDGYQWKGFLPRSELPKVVNPPKGVVGSANSNWLPTDYDRHITFDWAEHYRQDRLEQLFVASNQKQSMESMIAGQSDTYSIALVLFRDEALQQIPQGVRLNEDIQQALDAWDGRMEQDRPEPLILTAWHRHLLRLMLEDDLPNDFELVEKGRISRVLDMLRSTGARNWCNKVDTPIGESCGDILFESANLALDELRERFGENWRNWRWGDAHTTLHEHRPFTQVDALASYFTIRQKMAGGKYTLLRNSNDFSKDEPYAGVHGSALRTVYDFSDLEKSLMMISTGQSGNVMSPHYDDLAKKWGRMEYIPMVTKSANYRNEDSGGDRKDASKVFTFSPVEN